MCQVFTKFSLQTLGLCMCFFPKNKQKNKAWRPNLLWMLLIKHQDITGFPVMLAVA